jgi:anaerobic magnesium-protoporphyrin IX monomethyl ester cyclase
MFAALRMQASWFWRGGLPSRREIRPMKIVLVSVHTHPVALGLRYVSAYLKAGGHNVEALFMCSRKATTQADFAPAVLDAFIERCRRADLVGISLMTGNFHRAAALTETLRRASIKAPILWGGTHPSIAPEESLELADIVCVGEGEEPARLLADRLQAGGDPTGIPGLGFRAGSGFGNGRTFVNPVHPLESNLDKYPFPDYELATHWMAGKEGLVPATVKNLRGTLERLRVLTTRGCPYPCSFCNNTSLARKYAGKGPWVRRRSVDNIMGELVQLRRTFPSIEEINIVDDLFCVRNEDEMREFVDRYLADVNLPLEMDAHPNTLTEAKVAALSRLPLRLVSMGIQSASPDTLRNIYNRHTPVEKIIESMDLLHKYRVPAEYHYLINNPYEPDANVIETMRFVARHHRKAAVLRIFPLMFYPGSPLYDRARVDGLIGPRHQEAYDVIYGGSNQYAGYTYLAIWLRVLLGLRNGGMPTWMALGVVRFVASRPARWCLDRKWFPPAAFLTYLVTHKLYNVLIYQPFVKPVRRLRRRRRRKGRPQRHGDTETRRQGDKERGRQGDGERERLADKETRRVEDMEVGKKARDSRRGSKG